LIDASRGRGTIEDAHHGVLTVARRDGRDTQVDRATRHLGAEATVLRAAMFGDVELREHFHARDDGGAGFDREHLDRAQQTVDAEAQTHEALLGLDVDVRRALAQSARQDGIELRRGALLRHAGDGLLRRRHWGESQQCADLAVGRGDDFQRLFQLSLDRVEHVDVGGSRHRQHDHSLFLAQRHGRDLRQEIDVERETRERLNDFVGESDEGHAEVVGEHLRQILLAHERESQQHLADVLTGALLLLECEDELCGGDATEVDEPVTESLATFVPDLRDDRRGRWQSRIRHGRSPACGVGRRKATARACRTTMRRSARGASVSR
jgi:hypothetical protein